MRRNFTKILLLLLSLPLVVCGCNKEFDDSTLWDDIDKLGSSVLEVAQQTNRLSEELSLIEAIVNGGVISNISQNSSGSWEVSYLDSQNVEQTISIATKESMVDAPIMGVKEDGGVKYWTQTIKGETTFIKDGDGGRIPVSGRKPEIEVDGSGYWSVNGKNILDSAGNKVKAKKGNVSLFTDVVVDGDGNVLFTLGDGTTLTAQPFTAFNLSFSVGAVTTIQASDLVNPYVVDYSITGDKAATVTINIVKEQGLSALIDTNAKTITITFPSLFETGTLVLMVADNEGNSIIKPLRFQLPLGGTRGIGSAADLVDFAAAVNSGASINRWRDESGSVVLLNDIDLASVTTWIPIGFVTPSTTTANSAVTYTMQYPFEGVFDGKGYSITNITLSFDVGDGTLSYGLFGALKDAVIKNLTLGSASDASLFTLTGTAPQGATIGALVGYSESSKIESCKSYVPIAFKGVDPSNIAVRIGGLAGVINGGVIGGSASTACETYGTITCGTIANTSSSATGSMHVAGVCALLDGAGEIRYSTNSGAVSAPSGRGAGVVATGLNGVIDNCINKGTIQDDINGVFASNAKPYNLKRMGGIVGGTGASVAITNSINEGNVFSQLGCRTGGIIGHNGGTISACQNKGIILSNLTIDGTARHGAGWVAGFNSAAISIKDCVIGGKVGDYTANVALPASTPDATYANAVCHGNFSPETNGLNKENASYYDLDLISTSDLHGGVKYSHYSFRHIKQNVFIVEADMTNADVEISTAISNDIVPNPNANNNSNNGKNLRETLSEISARKRAEGFNVIAGINSGFFNSHDGFPRGFHIEQGEPMFINNPTVRTALTNHRPGLTFFDDRTISFANRDFKGLVEVDGVEYEYFSINDTIVRLNDLSHDANLYTSRFKQTPHLGIDNPVGSNALFIVGRSDDAMQVNKGYYSGTVTAIVDGRGGASVSVPFVGDAKEWVLQVTGAKADQLAAAVTVGKAIKICADVTIGGDASKPIMTHNASMYRFLFNGMWHGGTLDTEMPATVVGANQTQSKIYFIAVDGRTTSDKGLDLYELYMLCKKLGCHDAIRFDGGGSTTMWRYESGVGQVVNSPSDSNGERSCMNYLHIRIK